jgi:transposase-like protein
MLSTNWMPKCPKCGSDRLVFTGEETTHRDSQDLPDPDEREWLSTIMHYACEVCGRSFTVRIDTEH